MVIRADHVAGATVVGLALLVIVLSFDLPVGQLSMPGAGFMPLLVAGLIIILAGALFVRARESEPFSELDWSDGKHAASIIAIAAAAIALYTTLGFIIDLILMMVALLVIIERRNLVRAALYSGCMVTLVYLVFAHLLELPIPRGLLGY